MSKTLASFAALTMTVGIAHADITVPANVAFDYGAVAESLTGVPGDVAAGQVVMTNRGKGNCIACHAVTALKDFPFHGEVGPTLDGAGSRWSAEELRGIVANAKMMFEGTMMPSFYKSTGFTRPGDAFTGKAAPTAELPPLLTAQEVEDVVAYLLTLTDS